ncbi:MAG: hypothetical protein ACRYFX_16995 [Janthinobacterium lividum]
MPTEHYGGQGTPRYNSGTFVLDYRYINRNGRWADKRLTFSEYDKAFAKYESIDNTASIWDTTRGPELCMAKSRVAYYSAHIRGRKQKEFVQMVAIKAGEPEYAAELANGKLKKTAWVLLPETITEIQETDFQQLQANNPWA